ncbi:PAS domain S-box protein [bacterium]|nr:PAS domain S-box protein [bacterium]
MKISQKVPGVSILLGILYWIIDAGLDSMWFYDGSFIDLLIAEIPPHELYVRLFVLFLLTLFGILAGRWLQTRSDARARLEHLNAVLHAIRNVNQLITKENSRDKLIQGACDNLTETLGYGNAWIVLVDEDDKTVQYAHSGFSTQFQQMREQLAENVFPSCVRDALRHRLTVVMHDPPHDCRDCPLSYAYVNTSGFSRVLEYGGKTYGVLSVSVPRRYADNEYEKDLFVEVSDDIAFALYKIEVEEGRRLQGMILDSVGDLITVTDLEGTIRYVNDAVLRQLGRTRGELVGRPVSIYGDDPELGSSQLDILTGTLSEGHWRGEIANVTASGEMIILETHTWLMHDNEGVPILMCGVSRDITERRRMEEALHDAHRIVERSPVMVFRWKVDKNWTVAYASENVERILGYTAKQLTSGSPRYTNLIGSEDLKRVAGEVREHSDKPGTVSFRHAPYCLIARDGSEVWVEDITTIVRDETGQPVFYEGVVTDITERIEASRQAEVYQRSLETLMSNLPGMAFRCRNTPDWSMLFVSEGAYELTGLEAEELTSSSGQSFGDLIHPEDRDRIWQTVQAALAEDRPYELEYRLKLGDGTPKWVWERGRAVGIDEDGIRLIEGFISDVTPLREATESLVHSEERYRLLAETAQDIICVHDPDARIQYLNSAGLKFFGGTAEEVYGRSLLDFIPERDHEEAVQRRQLRHEGDRSRHLYNLHAIDRNGDAVPMEVSSSPIYRGDRLIGILLVARDISERVRAREEQERIEAQLRQAQKMEAVGRLAGGIAHDFNNMLNVIIGNTELALIDMEPNDPRFEYLKEIDHAADRSAELTRHLLAFSRRQVARPKVVNLNDEIAQEQSMLRRLLGEDIHIDFRPGVSLWNVRIDPSQVDQILANLAVNARDAIPGVGTITVETENIELDEAYTSHDMTLEPGEYVSIVFSDTGEGMTPEVMEKAFEPFFTTKGEGKGTGLGLSIVYGIIRQNEGMIHVYSEPGIGTTFKIYLPRFAGIVEPEGKSHAPDALHGNETILVVEDEAQVLNLAVNVLERNGYHVLVANSPEAALQISADLDRTVDLLLTDVVMPTMNGRELKRKIEQKHGTIRTLFMSGYTENVIVKRGLLEDDIEFIQKPFTVGALASKVRSVLDD